MRKMLLPQIHAFQNDALALDDAVGLRKRLHAREIQPADLVAAAFRRADGVEPQLQAIVCEDRMLALRQAARMVVDAGSPLFYGLPCYLKDNLPLPGLPARYGSAALAQAYRDLRHDPLTEQMLATGLVFLGKSTLPEFGLSATTEALHRPPTRNPWNPEYSCGASSGGAATLVASGVVPISHANDGGGSIRIPAACCGLVGLKTTRNRHIATRKARRLPLNIVSDGIVSRSVRDTAAFEFALERVYRNPRLPALGRISGPSQRRLRIGIVTDSIAGLRSHPENQQAVQDLALNLRALGHTTVACAMPVPDAFVNDFSDYWAYLAFMIDYGGKRVLGPAFDSSKLDGLTRGLAQRYARKPWSLPCILHRLRRHGRYFCKSFQDYDLLLTPTLGHPVARLGELRSDTPFEELFRRLTDYVCFTPIANVAGTPAISLPLATDSNGLPLGLHFMANTGQEALLLHLALELEQAGLFQQFAHKA